MSIKNIQYIIILSPLLLLTACGNNAAEPAQSTEKVEVNEINLTQAQLSKLGLVTDSLTTQSVSSQVKVSGKIDVPPQNMVSVSAPMGGFLRSTKLLPGMHLSKGEVIAVMEDQQYVQLQQDYLTTKYELEFLEKEYFRQKELSASKAASDKVFEQSKSNYLTQKTRLVALGEKLKLININPNTLSEYNLASRVTILSPINGYVSSVKVNIGKYIQSSEILFELVNPEDIHLNMTVFEKDIRHLSIGQQVKAYTNTDPSKIYPCEIILIGQDVSADRHIEVHCHFEKYDRSLIPGMYMNAIIESDAISAKVTDEAAIVSYAGKSYCFIELSPGTYRMVEVQTGLKQNGKIEIVNAEAVSGYGIVTKGAYTLLMKLKNVEEE